MLPLIQPAWIQNLEHGVPQTLLLFGTSLSYHLAPPLRDALRGRFGELATVVNAGLSAKASRTALDVLQTRVLGPAPDAVWIEFAVNDAYSFEEFPDGTRDKGISPAESRRNLETLIDAIAQALPRCEVAVQITNPTYDDTARVVLGASRRSELALFYAGYREVAAARHLKQLDACAMWQALCEQDSELRVRLLPDGVHPTPYALRTHLVPFLLRQLGLETPGSASLPTASLPTASFSKHRFRRIASDCIAATRKPKIMEKRTLGRSGLEITTLTFGCWQAGGDAWTDTDDESSLSAMRAGFEAGINFFDTAEGYGKGHSEELVGRFLREVGHGPALVATKVGDSNLAAPKLRAACEKSLKNLGAERIDLYQVHWPSGTWGSDIVPIEETMGELLKLQSEGKIGAIGVSNFNGAQIEEALQYGRIDSLQPPFSLFFQPYVQNGTLEVCVRHEIGVIPYSPLAQGLLTGKFNQENRPTDNRSGNQIFKDPTYSLALEAVEGLKPIAQKYGATTGNLSLAWLSAQTGVTSPIVGARNAEQIADTAKAASLHLEPADLEAISKLAEPVLASLSVDKTNPWK